MQLVFTVFQLLRVTTCNYWLRLLTVTYTCNVLLPLLW